jgi:hypothetical protein
MGDLADWDSAEAALAAALDNSGASWVRNEGDGAFYGPKIDVTITGILTASVIVRALTLFYSGVQMLSAVIINVEPFNWIFSYRESSAWSTRLPMDHVKRR